MSTLTPVNLNESSILITTIRKNFVNLYRILHEVDPRESDKFQSLNHHYFEKSHNHSQCKDKHHEHEHHNHGNKKEHNHDHDLVMKEFYIPEKEMTFTQQILYIMVKDYKFKEILPEIIEDLSKKFENIKLGGIKDKLKWDDEAEKFVLTKVLSEGIHKALVTRLRKEIQRDQHVESKQPLLLATPQSWYEKFPKVKLDFLSPDNIKDLFDKGYAIKKTFIDIIGFPVNLCNEVKYFYHEGRFESVTASEAETRSDRILPFQFTDLDPQSSKNLYHISRNLTSLPFELNLKANIYAQVSEGFQLSYFNKEDGFHKVHFDSSFVEKLDSGKKISALYIFSDKQNVKGSAKFAIHDEKSTEITEETDFEIGTLILIKSRSIPYSLSNIPDGTFILKYWINGPTDLKKNM